MAKVVRFGVSVEPGLMKRFDKAIKKHGYTNRSEAVRDLARNWLAELETRDKTSTVTATLMIVYDHHTKNLSAALNECQHEDHDLVVASTHIHLDRHSCLEIIVLKGRAGRIQTLANRLISTRGVRHGKLWMTHFPCTCA